MVILNIYYANINVLHGTSTPTSNTQLDVNGVVKANSFSEDGVYNVKVYGATGNGSTNDATSIQNAINAAKTAGGGVVYFPKGKYCINSSLSVSGSNIELRGLNRSASIIRVNTSNSGVVFSGGDENIISNLTFMKNNGDPDGGSAIDFGNGTATDYSGSTTPLVEKVRITASRMIGGSNTQGGIDVGKTAGSNFSSGILCRLWGARINNVTIDNAADTGIVLRSMDCNANVINECRITECLVGIKLNAMAGNSIANNWIADCPSTGIYVLSNGVGLNLGANITGNYIEGNGKDPGSTNGHNQIWFHRPWNSAHTWQGLSRGITVSGNFFNFEGALQTGGITATSPYDIETDQSNRCVFIGNAWYINGDAWTSEGVYSGTAPNNLQDGSNGRNVSVNGDLDAGSNLSVNGKLKASNLPTSSTGLSSGDFWRDASNQNILKVVP